MRRSAFCAAVLTCVVIGPHGAGGGAGRSTARGGVLRGAEIFAHSSSTRGAGTYTAELKLDETHNLLASPRARSCHIAREEHGATAQGGAFSK
jgi:hypothetical protein